MVGSPARTSEKSPQDSLGAREPPMLLSPPQDSVRGIHTAPSPFTASPVERLEVTVHDFTLPLVHVYLSDVSAQPFTTEGVLCGITGPRRSTRTAQQRLAVDVR